VKSHGRIKLFGRRGKKTESGEVALQITSMADIFTILLVFLLKGLSSDAIVIAPSNGTRLPAAVNTSSLAETAIQIELSKDGIMVEKELVSALEDFRVPAKGLNAEGNITTLGERLSKERERQKMINQVNDSVKIDGRAIIISDENVPFATMKPVLRTLAANGYSEIKFAVVVKE
jgi:biopolymer transport protein ExbD